MDLLPGSTVEVDVPAAGAYIFSAEQLTIAAGARVCAPSDGAHVFEYRSDGPAPVILGDVDPAPTLTAVAVAPCS